MATHHADDVSNEPTGAVKGPGKPTEYKADWLPDTFGGSDSVEAKTVEAPEKEAPRKQTRASKK